MAPRPVLLRIPFSHFCRKVEWGLTQAGIPYDALDVKLWQMGQARRANPKEGTVPVLRAGNRVVCGSHRILVWAQEHQEPDALPLYPEGLAVQVGAWEAWADDTVGPAVRREAYRALHADPTSLGKYPGVPWYLRSKATAPFSRRVVLAVLRHYKARRFDATDGPAICDAIVKANEQLQRTGTGYLFTDHPTAADYATAALFEPLVPIAQAKGYWTVPGYHAVAAHVARVRPAKTSLVAARGVREKDWRAFDALNATP